MRKLTYEISSMEKLENKTVIHLNILIDGAVLHTMDMDLEKEILPEQYKGIIEKRLKRFGKIDQAVFDTPKKKLTKLGL